MPGTVGFEAWAAEPGGARRREGVPLLIRRFLKEYKYFILIPFLLIALTALVLVLVSGGPQKGAFIYQIF